MAKSSEGRKVPRIGVVTVSYGSESVLPGFLESIPKASAESVKTVVADNRPEFGATERVTKLADADYLPMPANLGYGTAMNAAIAALPEEVEWVLISNPDVVLSKGCIDTLLQVAEADPQIASIGPAVLNADGSTYPSARAVPSIRTGVGHAMFVNLWPRNPWSRKYLVDSDTSPTARDAGWLSGSCLLVRRSCFQEVGGFDEGYFMYFEDVDLGYRFGLRGWVNRYEPSAKVTHSGAHSTTSTSASAARMIAEHHRSAKRFIAKKYSGRTLWPLRMVLTIGLNSRSAILSRRVRKAKR